MIRTLPRLAARLAGAVGRGTVISSGGYRLPCRAGHGEGKFHAEAGAARSAVGDFNGTTMLLNDTVGHRKPQAGAFARGLGGEERIVDAVEILGCNTVAGIGDFDARAQAVGPGADFKGSAGAHGVARVQEEVEE